MDKRGSNSLCNLKLTSLSKLVINVLKKLPPPHSFSLENFSLSIKILETILAMTEYLIIISILRNYYVSIAQIVVFK